MRKQRVRRALPGTVAACLLLSVCSSVACAPLPRGPLRETERRLVATRLAPARTREPHAEIQQRGPELTVYGWETCVEAQRIVEDYEVVTERDAELEWGALMLAPFLLGAAFTGLGAAMVGRPGPFLEDASAPRPGATADAGETCKSVCTPQEVRNAGFVMMGVGLPFLLWSSVQGIRALQVDRVRQVVHVPGPIVGRTGTCGDTPRVGEVVKAAFSNGGSRALGALDEQGSLRLSLPELGAQRKAEPAQIRVGETPAGSAVLGP